jgi:hypothetical protein
MAFRAWAVGLTDVVGIAWSCRCEALSYPTSGPDEVLVTRALGVVGGEDGRIERLG